MDTIEADGLERLTALLRANAYSKTASACLAALQSGELVSQEGSGGPIPRVDILNIYRRRAERNAEHNGNTIAGFPELLAGLEQLRDEKVCIYSLGFSSTHFLAFTNSRHTQLAGVLQIPGPVVLPATRSHVALAAQS